MKTTLLVAFIALLHIVSGTKLLAKDTDSVAESKAYYRAAKQELENMLEGKSTLSYERAIYLIENAYWDNQIDSNQYTKALDYSTDMIRDIFASNTAKQKVIRSENLWDDLKEYRIRDKGYREKALTNWSIFTYMTDTQYFITKGKISYLINQTPFTYSTTDPLGTIDWSNTQVTNLFTNGKGNCFALASLFKIYSERLHSDAHICTAPGHVYICHRNDKGTVYNVELSSRSFPGTGTMETLTYTTSDAVKNDISLRELDMRQSVDLCLVYLAKGYQYKFKVKGDPFALECAELALKYDSLNLNAMLLKAEVLETNLLNKKQTVALLQADHTFKEYQNFIGKIYWLGYREMPLEMKNILIKGWTRDTITALPVKDNSPELLKKANLSPTRYASLSWGKYDEEIRDKPLEKFSRTVFDNRKKKIIGFVNQEELYNNYNFDPVVFAWNIDPLSHKFPGQSPYAAFDNSPIWKNDPTGASGEVAIDKQSRTITISSNLVMYGGAGSAQLAKSTASDIQNKWNKANGTSTIDGVSYNVKFSVTGSYNANLQPGDISDNTSFRNNYIRVEETVKGGVSYMDGTGSNTGYFLLKNIEADGSTTEAHEFGHGYGEVKGTKDGHPKNLDLRGKGRPGIMYPRGTIVDSKYQYDPKASAGSPGGTLNPEMRKVNQGDIDNLGLPGLNYNSDGKANLGGVTNQYHEATK
jgi:hypothetical protein